jgi:hypothetical protein
LIRAQHPLHEHSAICQKFYKEIQQVVPDRTQSIAYKDVKNLPYLNAILYESMRVRVVGGDSVRISPPDGVSVCGILISEGVRNIE